MSTNDVPGADRRNADELAMGCWAEHTDGSLIFVLSTEDKRVVAEIYDMAEDPILVYKFAAPVKEFQERFSWPPVGKSKEKWTWHDKTPFPWDRIIKTGRRPRPQIADAEEEISAATRVARSLHLRARKIRREDLSHRTDDVAEKTARGIIERIGQALVGLGR